MNRPSKQPPVPQSTRLQMLSALPTISDVNNLLSEARKGAGKVFHLPWVVEAKGLLYDLGCAASLDAMDPQWTLSTGSITGGLSTTALWSHASPDLDLILNLCLMECEVQPAAAPVTDTSATFSALRDLVSADQASKKKEDYNTPLQPVPAPVQTVATAEPPPQAVQPTSQPVPQMPQTPPPVPQQVVPPSTLPQPFTQPHPMPQPMSQPMPQPIAQPMQQQIAPLQPQSGPSAVHGRLEDLPPNNLLQSLTVSKVTGRLIVQEKKELITLLFEDGNLVHATCRQGDGELAVLELLTWNRGTYTLMAQERSAERSIQRRIDMIVLDCLTLVHNQQHLERLGLNMSCYLIRKNLSLTEVEFENATKNVHCNNREMLKMLYQQIDQHSNFLELLRKFPVSKLDWLPALYTLVTTSLVEISDKPSQQRMLADFASVGVDVLGVKTAYEAILRPGTGIMSYQLFLNFLEQEFYRYERSRQPFTLFVFSIAKDAGFGLEPLDEAEMRALAQAIDAVKRKIDILGHFQSFDYAMILPMTNVAGALIFANRVMEIISDGTICSTVPASKVFFSGGLASMPEDSMKVELLLPAAIEAKSNARDTGKSISAYKNMRGNQ